MIRLPGPRLAVGGVIGLLLAMSLASVAIWGRNIGLAEDWVMVPAMTGRQPDLLSWLWSQNNEHRLPVQRLIYLGLLRLTGDFRSGMVFSQFLLAFLAMTLAWAAASMRGGRSRWSDTLFPLALLHLGHWENLVWGWQIQFVWSTFLAGALLAIVAAHSRPLGAAAGLAAAVILVFLPISGANGIVIAAAMAPWLVAQGAMQISPDQLPATRRTGFVLIGAAVLSMILIGVYFFGYVRPPWSPPPATLPEFFSASKIYFAYALGPAARWYALPAALGVLVFIGCGGLLAARALFYENRNERLRAGGLTLFIGVGLTLGLVIAWARGSYSYRMPDRYALFAALPLLTAAYAWELYAPRRLGRNAVAVLVLLFLVLLPLNIRAGFEWRNWYVGGMQRVEADITGGLPIAALAERHYPFLMHWSENQLHDAVRMLHDAGITPFALAAAD